MSKASPDKPSEDQSDQPEASETKQTSEAMADAVKPETKRPRPEPVRPRVSLKRKSGRKGKSRPVTTSDQGPKQKQSMEASMPERTNNHIYMLNLVFNNLTGGGNAIIELGENAQWSLGYGEVGLSMSLPTGGNFPVESLRVTPSTLTLRLGEAVVSLPVTIYVETRQRIVSGQVILPDGSSVVIQSPTAYTSVLAGGWAIEV